MKIEGVEVRVKCLGFRVQVVWCRIQVQGWESRVKNLRFRA